MTEDSHFTYCMEYAETYRTESSDLHVFLMPKQPASEKNGQLLTLLSQTNTQLYVCAYIYDYAPAQGARRAASVADDDRWTAVGSNLHELTIPDLGATELYIVNAKAVKATGHDKVGDLESEMMTVGYDNNGNLSGIESSLSTALPARCSSISRACASRANLLPAYISAARARRPLKSLSADKIFLIP